jgi:hypothetical protein
MFTSQGTPPVSTTPVANLPPVSATPAANFAAVPLVLLIPVANLPPVSTIPEANVANNIRLLTPYSKLEGNNLSIC